MNRHETAATLRRWALEEGFDRAGVASLEPSAHGGHLRRWLARGEHAEMAYMARRVELREDPARLLPGARTALCVALQYWPLAERDEPAGDLWPRVARYARGRDYHVVMGKGLKRLAARVREAFPGCGTRPYVDTGPILERELAARAGLGSFGKNTCLLDRHWGSYFLLGELLLTLDAAPAEEPATDLCGRCTRCLDACPTGALREPYRLDSELCISYWTIEHRGVFPETVREGVGEWVFGCDVCQEVCPYNRRPEAVDHPELELSRERAELDLATLLALDHDGYVRFFPKSAIKRAKLPGLKRNAATVMGNRGARHYVPALVAALEREDEPVVRRHVVWALGRIGGDEAVDGLRRARAGETEPAVRAELERALERVDRGGESG